MSTRDQAPPSCELLPITEVERQTGIRQATLRMWERRYGFPQPSRDRHGDRVYPPHQVERLHAVRRLIDQGVRPGKIFSGAVAIETADPCAARAHATAASPHNQHIIALLRDYRLPELHASFRRRLLGLGLRRFVIEFLAPLSVEVGLAWNRGQLPVRCEHLFGQLAAAVLQAELAPARLLDGGRPKVLLATLGGETHALGILMVEAVLASFEAACIPLGTDTPLLEVTAAARETGVDIVALSFSSYFPRRSLAHDVAALRAALPSSAVLWIGGDGARHVAVPGPGIEAFDTLEAIGPALARWQAAPHQSPALRRAVQGVQYL